MSLRTIVNIFALAFCVHIFAALVTPICPSCLAFRETISAELAGPAAATWPGWSSVWEWAGLLAAAGLGAAGVWLIDRRKWWSMAASPAGPGADDGHNAEAVRVVVNALGSQRGSQRMEMLKALERRLPYRLTAQEAATLLGGERGSLRVEMIQVLGIRLPAQLSTSEAVALLGPLRGSDRVDAIHLLVDKLGEGTNVTPLLVTLDGNQRMEAVRLLN